MSASPYSVKRVRFSPDVKDSDDMSMGSSSQPSSPRVIPKTPRKPLYGLSYPSPALSDVSSVGSFDMELLIHSLLLPPPAPQRAIYDVRGHPQAQAYYTLSPSQPQLLSLQPQLHLHATQPALRRMQLVSQYLPWTIVVENPSGVTIGDILVRINASLSKTAAKHEYEGVDERQQQRILSAYKKNCAPGTGRTLEMGLRRVDWLADKTIMGGIRKDDAYIRARVVDPNMRAETFVLDFISAK